MPRRALLLLVLLGLLPACAGPGDTQPAPGPSAGCTGACPAFTSGQYRSLFSQVGKTRAEVDARMERVANHFLNGRDDVDQWRFSTGLLYMMGFMEASGKYRVW